MERRQNLLQEPEEKLSIHTSYPLQTRRLATQSPARSPCKHFVHWRKLLHSNSKFGHGISPRGQSAQNSIDAKQKYWLIKHLLNDQHGLHKQAMLLHKSPPKSSCMDTLPTSLLLECHHSFSEIIAHLANMSFTDGKFPSRFKTASVTPLLKSPSLDESLPSSSRPISNSYPKSLNVYFYNVSNLTFWHRLTIINISLHTDLDTPLRPLWHSYLTVFPRCWPWQSRSAVFLRLKCRFRHYWSPFIPPQVIT